MGGVGVGVGVATSSGPSRAEQFERDEQVEHDEQVERPLGMMAGLGAVLMTAVTLDSLLADVRDAPLWWSIPTTAMLVVALITAIGSRSLPIAALRWAWRIVPLGGLVMLVSWAFEAGDTVTVPWIYLFFPSMVGFASVAWGWRGALVYTVVGALVLPLLAATNLVEVAPALGSQAALQLTNVGFVAIFQGVRHQLTALQTASRAASRARIELAVAQVALAERERMAALVHDEVLSALLAVSRNPNGEEASEQTTRALAVVRAEIDDDDGEPAVTVDLAARLRAELGSVLVELTPVAEVPAAVGVELLAATREAVRNARTHAGGLGLRVEIGNDDGGGGGGGGGAGGGGGGAGAGGGRLGSVCIVVSDAGPGFSSHHVGHDRLGLARSIRQRVDQLPGGTAEVHSAPGRGTRVVLRWRREGL